MTYLAEYREECLSDRIESDYFDTKKEVTDYALKYVLNEKNIYRVIDVLRQCQDDYHEAKSLWDDLALTREEEICLLDSYNDYEKFKIREILENGRDE